MNNYLIYRNHRLVAHIGIKCNPPQQAGDVAQRAAEQYRQAPTDSIIVSLLRRQ